MEEQRNTLVIGYSFKDKHINDVLLENVEERDGKILVISPSIPENIPTRKNVLFYQLSLVEVIQNSSKWIEIQRQLFN